MKDRKRPWSPDLEAARAQLKDIQNVHRMIAVKTTDEDLCTTVMGLMTLMDDVIALLTPPRGEP